MNSFVYIGNKSKGILILGKGPTQGLGNTALTGEAKYPVNLIQLRKRFALSLHYNGREATDYALCLGNISKDFTINNMKKLYLKEV